MTANHSGRIPILPLVSKNEVDWHLRCGRTNKKGDRLRSPVG
ncbi:hypothetical protein [Oscillatoria sp. FACHB-1407]|nr:hypothetical protein [Oscillatoria sp. FACHB-1407]